MITIRPLRSKDIPHLPSIRPTYQSPTVLALIKDGHDLSIQWRLVERRLTQPFDKGTLYDFGPNLQLEIRGRFNQAEQTYQRVAEDEGHLVGLLDMEYEAWNNTVFLWNLMIDLDYRQKGLGRRLWHRGLEYAAKVEARAIMIETQNTNVAACRFYLRMGCQLAGFHEAHYANDGADSETAKEFALFWAYFLAGH